MPRPVYDVMSAAELIDLARRACAILDANDAGEGDAAADEEEPANDRWARRSAAIDALRYVAAAAPAAGAVGVLPYLRRAVAAVDSGYARDTTPFDNVIAATLRALRPRLAAVTPELTALAACENVTIRAATAAALRPFDAAAVRLLEQLAADPDPKTRVAARANLGPAHPLPWWCGLFPADPNAGRSADEAAALDPALQRAAAVVNTDRWGFHKRDLREAVAPLEALPDPLAVTLYERLLMRPDVYQPEVAAWAPPLLRRPGGEEALARLCSAWGLHDPTDLRAKTLAALAGEIPDDRRLAICTRLLRVVREVPENERDNYRRPGYGVAKVAAVIAASFWPSGTDPTPLLETILGVPPTRAADAAESEYRHDVAASSLGEAFARPDVDIASLLPVLVPACARGWPGAFKRRLPTELRSRVEAAYHPELRAAAEQALSGPDESRRSWAMRYLVGGGHDPRRDPPVPEVLERFYRDPALRTLVLQDSAFLARVLPTARRDLRAGRLSLEEIQRVLHQIHNLWGGMSYGPFPRDPGFHARYAREQREKYDAWLGPEELRGPITAEEWDVMRAARDATPVHGQGCTPYGTVGCLAPGPWHPADLDLVRRSIENGKASGSTFFLELNALVAKPSPESEALVVDLVEHIVRSGDPRALAACLHVAGDDEFPAAAKRLLPTDSPSPVAPSAADAAAVEWMDQPDDEDH